MLQPLFYTFVYIFFLPDILVHVQADFSIFTPSGNTCRCAGCFFVLLVVTH